MQGRVKYVAGVISGSTEAISGASAGPCLMRAMLVIVEIKSYLSRSRAGEALNLVASCW